MDKLTINFQFMFLLVNHLRGAVVALPAKGHKCVLKVDQLGIKHGLKGYQVDIVDAKDFTKRIWGTPCDRPTHKHLVQIDDVFGRGVNVIRGVVDGKVDPSKLNLRVVLGSGGSRRAGRFTEQDASDNGFKRVIWRFAKPNGGFHTQELTDRLMFELDLQPNKDYAVVFKGPSPIDPIILKAGKSWVIDITNDDDDEAKREANDDTSQEDYELTEYNLIWDLLDVGLRPLGPFGRGPAGRRRAMGPRSTDDPICGGGQGDPPDPPPDPPDPDPGP